MELACWVSVPKRFCEEGCSVKAIMEMRNGCRDIELVPHTQGHAGCRHVDLFSFYPGNGIVVEGLNGNARVRGTEGSTASVQDGQDVNIFLKGSFQLTT